MRLSQQVRRNVVYSVVDYASQPAMMILAAPLLLRGLGVQQYGTWMLVNSIAGAASGLGGGFGDGATKYVASYRGIGDTRGAVRSLLSVLVVNCALGVASAGVMVLCAPWLIDHVFAVEPALRNAAVIAVRISAALLVVRFAESIFTAAIRGCETYRPVVLIAVLGRLLIVLAALVLTETGRGLVAILWATLVIAVLILAAQARLAHIVLHANGLWSIADIRAGVSEVFTFGAFTWTKSTLGVLTGYADRLLVAALLGTGPLAFYTLCNQITQPIHSLLAAAFNFVFPNFASHSALGQWNYTRRAYANAVRVSAGAVIIVGTSMALCSRMILSAWLGSNIARLYQGLLVTMVIGNGLLALSVVPHYAALAFGRARALVWINLFAGMASLSAAYLLIHRFGLIGAGLGRIVAGAVFMTVFAVVHRALPAREGTALNTELSALGFTQQGCDSVGL